LKRLTLFYFQLGLSIFVNKPDSNRYDCRTYNFTVLPRPFGHNNPVFESQVEGIEFLTSHGFDWNKVNIGALYQGRMKIKTFSWCNLQMFAEN
jgi:CAF1 family ribonuclease